MLFQSEYTVDAGELACLKKNEVPLYEILSKRFNYEVGRFVVSKCKVTYSRRPHNPYQNYVFKVKAVVLPVQEWVSIKQRIRNLARYNHIVGYELQKIINAIEEFNLPNVGPIEYPEDLRDIDYYYR